MDALMSAARVAGVKDERLLAAIVSVPRSEFVPAERADLADVDTPIPISHEQVTTQSSLVARIVEALALRGRRAPARGRYRLQLADGPA
jgi:protein-L-isoaspartate(D-aspartate) O-methyltransferase